MTGEAVMQGRAYIRSLLGKNDCFFGILFSIKMDMLTHKWKSRFENRVEG